MNREPHYILLYFFLLSKFSEGKLDLQVIVLRSVLIVGVTFGVSVIGSYVAYLFKKSQQRKNY